MSHVFHWHVLIYLFQRCSVSSCQDINQRMEFAIDPESLDKIVNIESHDIVFWMGDLNYRIHDPSLSTDQIKQV